MTTRRRDGWLTSVKPASSNTWRAPTCRSPQVITLPGSVVIAYASTARAPRLRACSAAAWCEVVGEAATAVLPTHHEAGHRPDGLVVGVLVPTQPRGAPGVAHEVEVLDRGSTATHAPGWPST